MYVLKLDIVLLPGARAGRVTFFLVCSRSVLRPTQTIGAAQHCLDERHDIATKKAHADREGDDPEEEAEDHDIKITEQGNRVVLI